MVLESVKLRKLVGRISFPSNGQQDHKDINKGSRSSEQQPVQILVPFFFSVLPVRRDDIGKCQLDACAGASGYRLVLVVSTETRP